MNIEETLRRGNKLSFGHVFTRGTIVVGAWCERSARANRDVASALEFVAEQIVEGADREAASFMLHTVASYLVECSKDRPTSDDFRGFLARAMKGEVPWLEELKDEAADERHKALQAKVRRAGDVGPGGL